MCVLTCAKQTCAVIYVSTDTDPEAPGRVLAGQAWLRMVFEDNSDFAPIAPYSEGKEGEAKRRMHEAAVEDVKRGEDFVQAGVRVDVLSQGSFSDPYAQEVEMGVEKISFGTDESCEWCGSRGRSGPTGSPSRQSGLPEGETN